MLFEPREGLDPSLSRQIRVPCASGGPKYFKVGYETGNWSYVRLLLQHDYFEPEATPRGTGSLLTRGWW